MRPGQDQSQLKGHLPGKRPTWFDLQLELSPLRIRQLLDEEKGLRGLSAPSSTPLNPNGVPTVLERSSGGCRSLLRSGACWGRAEGHHCVSGGCSQSPVPFSPLSSAQRHNSPPARMPLAGPNG